MVRPWSWNSITFRERPLRLLSEQENETIPSDANLPGSRLVASQQDVQRMNQQAVQHDQLGRYAAAMALSAQSLELRRGALGEDHPSFATSLNNLAFLYQSMGNYAAAEPLYRE